MFNTTNNSKVTTFNDITFNSTGGTLIKSCAESKFIKVSMNSDICEAIFDQKKPHRFVIVDNWRRDETSISVLQVMLCGGDNLMVEYVDLMEER